jgi:hypothetical protein
MKHPSSDSDQDVAEMETKANGSSQSTWYVEYPGLCPVSSGPPVKGRHHRYLLVGVAGGTVP